MSHIVDEGKAVYVIYLVFTKAFFKNKYFRYKTVGKESSILIFSFYSSVDNNL